MEPAQAEIKTLKINRVIHTKVLNVFNEVRKEYVSGVGPTAIFKNIDLGWYVSFEGSYEALFFGYTKPEYNVGDSIKIIFEKVD